MINVEKIAEPANIEDVKAELNEDTFLRYTNKGQNEIYLVTAHSAPNVMHEIGRLREEAFRTSGGGTGKALDIDQYDISEYPYLQMVVWNPDAQEIMAGYRVMECAGLLEKPLGLKHMATSHLFNFSQKFVDDFLPNTLELGRSFVQPKYQRGSESKKGLFALDNLWDGLGGILSSNPKYEYMLGKVTMYPSFDTEARNAILGFLEAIFHDPDDLLTPIVPLVTKAELKSWIDKFRGRAYKEVYVELNSFVRGKGLNIPPLISSYMNLSDTMRTFGTMLNDEFGDVEETGILVTTADIHPSKHDRHLATYERDRKFGSPHWK